ncbi:MAG: hypothetical protein FJX00_02285 [Alphaproteobacteria bacterium]|nr:hypothetical protein [Alphaproteobacteria bacterium]
MNKILTIFLALGAVATTQAELHDDHTVKHFDHCMDALGKNYADLDEGRRHRHCDNAVGVKTWGALKSEMEEKRHREEISRYMKTHG